MPLNDEERKALKAVSIIGIVCLFAGIIFGGVVATLIAFMVTK